MKEKTRKSYDTEKNMEFRQKRIELVYEARKYSPEPHLGRYLELLETDCASSCATGFATFCTAAKFG